MKMTVRLGATLAFVSAAVSFALPFEAHAFKLRPHATDTESKVHYLEAGRVTRWMDTTAARIVEHFSSAVHEEITQRIYGCALATDQSCVDPLPYGKFAPKSVLFGVQWNDNPPFQLGKVTMPECREVVTGNLTLRLPNFSRCWVALFKDAEKKSRTEYFDGDSGHALIYRVHFGDLQFLHSMASGDGESSRDTKAKILAWAQLMYRASIDDLDIKQPLSASTISEIKAAFLRNGWKVDTLLTLGQGGEQNHRDAAFGSLLHVVQDSFASGHVQRDVASASSICEGHPNAGKAGDILEFHSYEHQNKDEHGRLDSLNFFASQLIGGVGPSVVEIGKTLVAFRAQSTPWSVVGNYLSLCVFPVPEHLLSHRAGPGSGDLRQSE